MKKILTILICMAGLSAVACTGGERPVTMDQLPATARQFLLQHFDGVTVAHATEEVEVMTKRYNLWFVSGDKIEFAGDGAWVEVDCKHSAVPMSVVAMPVVNYLSKYYPAVIVKRLERSRRNYEVTLDNGMELKFDKNYNLRSIDD